MLPVNTFFQFPDKNIVIKRDFPIFTEKNMLKAPFLLTLIIAFNLGFLAQKAFSQDTLVHKNVSISRDTTFKTTEAPKQQDQPAKPKVRKDTRPLKDRINFDLGTSFWVNPHQVFGEVSFLISYRFPKILSIGTGPVYIFNYQRGPKENLNGWGGKVFARASLLKFIYLWTEYQGIDNQLIDGGRAYVDSWFLGAGLNIRLGRRFGINMSVLYDVLYNSSNSPYYSPVIYRLGFSL